MSQIGPFERATITYRGVGFIEWHCWWCGQFGNGFMPEHHSSGACEVTRTLERTAPFLGFEDGGGI